MWLLCCWDLCGVLVSICLIVEQIGCVQCWNGPLADSAACPGRRTPHMCPLPPLLRPADWQARGQGAARRPADRPAQGRESGSQEAESRVPGVTRTSPQRWGAGLTFPFKLKFVFIFLQCYELEAAFVHVKLKSVFWSGLVVP